MQNLCSRSPSLLIKLNNHIQIKQNKNHINEGNKIQLVTYSQQKKLCKPPVHKARKFSAVWGTSSPNNPITILPASLPTGFPILISKNTLFVIFDCTATSWNLTRNIIKRSPGALFKLLHLIDKTQKHTFSQHNSNKPLLRNLHLKKNKLSKHWYMISRKHNMKIYDSTLQTKHKKSGNFTGVLGFKRTMMLYLVREKV